MRHSLDKYNRLLTEQTSIIYAGHVDIEVCNCDNLGTSVCSQFMGWSPNQGWNHGHMTIDGRTPVVGDKFRSGGPNQYGSTMVTYKVVAVNSYWDANDCGDWNYGTSWSSPGSFNAGGGQSCADRNFSNDCGPAPDVECFTCNNNQIDSAFFPNPTGCPSGWNTLPPFDPSSCVPDVAGCTDTNATNYDSAAITDDGSCEGCMDPWAQNHCGLCTIDDGSCTYMSILGCMDPLALNFNTNATVDDGSCTYTPITTPVGVENPLTVLTHANPTIETKYCSCCEEGGGGFSISTPIPINDLCAQFNDPSNGISNCVETTKWNKEDCEERELPEKFSCDRKTGNCYPDPTGPFITMADCKKECRPDRGGDRWMCEGGNCYPNPNGQFTTQQDCEAKCGNDERLKEEINRIKELLH